MRQWADGEVTGEGEWEWFELAAAASGQLAIFALLALAAEPEAEGLCIDRTFRAYWPLLPLVATMLDSFVDQPEDLYSGDHLYVAHYVNPERALSRICALIERGCRELAELPDGHRHNVVLGCMITFYLSKESARTGAMKPMTEQMIRAGGSLSRVLAPVLRTWRLAYSQSSA